MKKYVKKYESGCKMFEIITIDKDIITCENLYSDNKAVWKTKEKNLHNELGWKNEKDYIIWIKELEFKELKEYKDNLIWINPVTKEQRKQYEFNI